MAVPFIKVLHISAEDVDATNPPTVDLTGEGLFDLQDKHGLEAKSNTFSLSLSNAWRRWAKVTDLIKVDDLIKIYVSWEPIDVASDAALLMVGTVTEVPSDISERERKLTVKGVDKTYLMLNKLWSYDYSKEERRIPEIVKHVVRTVTERKKKTPAGDETIAYDIDARLTTEGGFIDSKRPDANGVPDAGDDFPKRKFSMVFKTVYEWLKYLSEPGVTNEASELAGIPVCKRPFIFYVDEKNRLHWTYPSGTALPTALEEGQLMGFKFGKSKEDVINMVIFNAGEDPDGHGILGWYADPTSPDIGLRMKFFPWREISEAMKPEDKKKEGWQDPDNDGYPEPGGNELSLENPWSPGWKPTYEKDEPDILNPNILHNAGDTFYVFSQAQYKSAFRKEAKRRAQNLAMKKIAASSLRWEANITLRGTTAFRPGDLVNCRIFSDGYGFILEGYYSRILVANANWPSGWKPTSTITGAPLKIRVNDVTQRISRNGWVTTLEIVEDPAELQGR